MNKVLSLLLAFVFLQTQSWALSGGPVFTSGVGQQTPLVGVYAGALLPSGDHAVVGDSNGLGLFTLSVPEAGLGVGDFVYFSEGRTFTGFITGVADPERGTLTGLLKGQFDVTTDSIQVIDPTFGNASATFSEPGGFANGEVAADFIPSVSFGVSASTGIPFQGLRIEGTANVEISEFRETVTREPGVDDGDPTTDDRVTVTTTTVGPVSTVTLTVDGFRQTTTPGDTTINNFGPNP